ncbi:unnamed protein product [Trichobilharzia regenti]|nr:unnamed protein product [Trichobilharzia regenti]
MLAFNIVLTITGACILMHHGFTLIFYFFVALQSRIPVCPQIKSLTMYLIRYFLLFSFIFQIVSFIIRDYITPWYNSLTPDNAFPMELHKLLLRVFASVVKRVSEVDWVPFLTETLPSFLATHVRLYRTMLERRITYPDKDAVKLFFDIEAEMEKNVCREEVYHLRLLSDMFLFFITPVEDHFISVTFQELLVNSVLMPTINLLSDPDFVNRTISWFVSHYAFTFLSHDTFYGYFILLLNKYTSWFTNKYVFPVTLFTSEVECIIRYPNNCVRQVKAFILQIEFIFILIVLKILILYKSEISGNLLRILHIRNTICLL